MPRQRRIVLAGEIHHVMSRGIAGEAIVRDDEDRERFLSLCGKALTEGGCLCFAWVLMDNHYHLVLRPLDQSLQRIMRRINGGYALGYNKKYGRRGYLFQDRYRSLATQEYSYIRELIRYVHLNPVRAGIVKTLDSLRRYPWSGHAGLLGEYKRDWHSVHEALSRFGKTEREARAAYLEWMSKKDIGSSEGWMPHAGDTAVDTESGTLDERVAGDHEFVREALSVDRLKTARLFEKRRNRPDLENLLQSIAKKYKIPVAGILEKHRWSAGMSAKAAFCREAVREYGYSHGEVARFLWIDAGRVNRLAWRSEGQE